MGKGFLKLQDVSEPGFQPDAVPLPRRLSVWTEQVPPVSVCLSALTPLRARPRAAQRQGPGLRPSHGQGSPFQPTSTSTHSAHLRNRSTLPPPRQPPVPEHGLWTGLLCPGHQQGRRWLLTEPRGGPRPVGGVRSLCVSPRACGGTTYPDQSMSQRACVRRTTQRGHLEGQGFPRPGALSAGRLPPRGHGATSADTCGRPS